MRVRRLCVVMLAVLCALVFGRSSGAQVTPCVQGYGGGMMYGIQSQKDAPFSGVVRSSFEQKLADGNVIHSVTRTRQARDASGRTMTEMAHGCAPGADGKMYERLGVSVSDPVARTNISWTVGDEQQPKIVTVYHMPEPPAGRDSNAEACKVLSAEEVAAQEKMMKAAMVQQRPMGYRSEDLGIKDFNGVAAHGTRNTRTIPPGQEGNEQPLVTIDETWRSNELGLMMMSINDDPRRGRTVTEYEQLDRGEPDAALFAAPAGCTVQEQPLTQVGRIVHPR